MCGDRRCHCLYACIIYFEMNIAYIDMSIESIVDGFVPLAPLLNNFLIKNIEHTFLLWRSGSYISCEEYKEKNTKNARVFFFLLSRPLLSGNFASLFAICLCFALSDQSFIHSLSHLLYLLRATTINDFITSIEYFIGFNRKAINVCSFLTLLLLLLPVVVVVVVSNLFFYTDSFTFSFCSFILSFNTE